jgi:gliding motility-associated protein GldM
MATGKQSLRQKMINMMYLVLLAILALNVSAEVLKAFHMMEVSMRKTGENIDAKNNLVLQSFSNLMKTQPERTKEWDAKAQEGKKTTEEFVKYIENLKRELADLSGGRVINDAGVEGEVKNSDNTEKHANYLLNKGKAIELKAKINSVRDKLLALVPQEDRKNIKTDLYTIDENGKTWEVTNFEGVPIAAVMATMTMLQNDCKNTYADVLQVLYSKIGYTVTTVDKLSAKVIPKSPYVMAGEKFEADVFLTAYDTKQPAEIVLNGQTYSTETGVLNYTTVASGQGEQTIKGVIKVKEKEGLKEYPFETKYNVFSGFAAVSADAMKVLYVGLDNPISISVPGVPTDNVIATISNGTLRKVHDNQYVAKVTAKGNITINISVRNADGSVKSFGQHVFKGKNIPGASARLGSLKPAAETKTTLLVMNTLFAIPDFDIGFTNMTYKVTSYKCLIRRKNEVIGPLISNGSTITQAIKDNINTLKKGDIVIFTDIKGQGPVGAIAMTDIAYTIK